MCVREKPYPRKGVATPRVLLVSRHTAHSTTILLLLLLLLMLLASSCHNKMHGFSLHPIYRFRASCFFSNPLPFATAIRGHIAGPPPHSPLWCVSSSLITGVAPPIKKCHFADFLHKSTTGSTSTCIFLVRHSVALQTSATLLIPKCTTRPWTLKGALTTVWQSDSSFRALEAPRHCRSSLKCGSRGLDLVFSRAIFN